MVLAFQFWQAQAQPRGSILQEPRLDNLICPKICGPIREAVLHPRRLAESLRQGSGHAIL